MKRLLLSVLLTALFSLAVLPPACCKKIILDEQVTLDNSSPTKSYFLNLAGGSTISITVNVTGDPIRFVVFNQTGGEVMTELHYLISYKTQWTVPYSGMFEFHVETMAVQSIVTIMVESTWTRSFILYGSYNRGWGFTPINISSPGPTLVVEQGDTVDLDLVSWDGMTHRFFVSYSNASSANSTEPQSEDIPPGVSSSYQFVTTDTVGTYTYGCSYHYSTMKGYFQVVPTGAIPEFQPLTLLSLLIVSTIVVALLHDRSVQRSPAAATRKASRRIVDATILAANHLTCTL